MTFKGIQKYLRLKEMQFLPLGVVKINTLGRPKNTTPIRQTISQRGGFTRGQSLGHLYISCPPAACFQAQSVDLAIFAEFALKRFMGGIFNCMYHIVSRYALLSIFSLLC